MKAGLTVAVLVLAVAPLGLVKDPPSDDNGLLSMDSSSCGTAEKGSKTVA